MNTAARLAPTRELWAWACYDFANSGYTTVVLTTIYSAWFVGSVAAGVGSGSATLLWTLATATANACVLLSAPVLGAIADLRAGKKRFLAISTAVCVTATALLALPGPGDIVFAMLLVVISAVAFASGENLIAAFLPEIAPPEQMGRISGYGWSLGYCGGLLTLGLCLAWVGYSEGQGRAATDYVPVTLLLTAAIFALAAAPTFIWLRERAVPRRREPGLSVARAAWRRVGGTLAHRHALRDLFRFLLAMLLYQAGVATVVVVAAIYAQEELGFGREQLILLIMVVNVTAAVGSLVFGFAQDRFGSVPSLVVTLLLWIAAIGISYASHSTYGLWFAGNLIGLAMGASQAGSRALVGRLTPVSHSGEFFGLWGVAARAAAIVGPLCYGVASQLTGDQRVALLSTLVLFGAGLVALLGVNEERGMQARERFDAG